MKDEQRWEVNEKGIKSIPEEEEEDPEKVQKGNGRTFYRIEDMVKALIEC